MRALAITGMETAEMMLSIMSGSLMRDTPPWARMSAGTRSRAMTATAPASSAILACSAVTTSMMTPPLSISAMPRLTREVPTVCSDMASILRAVRCPRVHQDESAWHSVVWQALGILPPPLLGRCEDPLPGFGARPVHDRRFGDVLTQQHRVPPRVEAAAVGTGVAEQRERGVEAVV